MAINFSDRKIMAAGLGIYMVMDINSQEEAPDSVSVSGAFMIEVTDNNLDNGEEITETTEETS